MINQYVHQKKQLCTSCGVCAGICTAITMHTDTFGHYYPKVDQTKCIYCGKCMSVCPMRLGEEEKERLNCECWKMEDLPYKLETGYYLGTYEGAIPEYRNKSASGGFCSALLCELLNKKYVQSVYTACANNDSEKYFISKRLTTCDEVNASRGSAYYPIEISETLRSIQRLKEKTAIVCLPCQATAIRQAMKKNKVLKESIRFIIGLVCGGMPGKSMVEYIANDMHCDLQHITKISFREKNQGIKCNNCQIKLYNGESEECVSRYHNGESFGFVYLNHILHNPSCNTCTDIFAEQADAVFGDAWFDENKMNELGTSICITRNPILDQLMKEMKIRESTIERMIEAQKSVGLIEAKKRLSFYYKDYYQKKGYSLEENKNLKLSRKTQIRVALREWFAEKNRKSWSLYKAGVISFSQLKKRWYRMISLKKRMGI